MNKNQLIAIGVIAVIAVAAVGIYVMVQPVPNPYNVAIVFATGGLGDKSFNDGCYEGALRAKNLHNINFTYSEPTAIAEYETFLRRYASHAGYIEPFDLIISIGFDQADAVMAVAADYPDQQFAIIDMFIDPVEYPNVASILFTENEGSALVGAIAGLMTETNKIGFLGGMDIPLIRKFAAGYVWGASLARNLTGTPDLERVVTYVGDWANIPLGKSLTEGMYEDGADIVFAAAGRSGLGAFEAAKEGEDVWVIGVDSPQMYLGTENPDDPEPPTVCLTSMLKRVDVAVYDTMKAAVLGTWEGGLIFYDLENYGHDYEINEDLLTLPQNVIDMAEMIREGIINGTYVVPDDIWWT